MPQLDIFSYPPQLFWIIIIFFLTFRFISFKILPKILVNLKLREKAGYSLTLRFEQLPLKRLFYRLYVKLKKYRIYFKKTRTCLSKLNNISLDKNPKFNYSDSIRAKLYTSLIDDTTFMILPVFDLKYILNQIPDLTPWVDDNSILFVSFILCFILISKLIKEPVTTYLNNYLKDISTVVHRDFDTAFNHKDAPRLNWISVSPIKMSTLIGLAYVNPLTLYINVDNETVINKTNKAFESTSNILY